MSPVLREFLKVFLTILYKRILSLKIELPCEDGTKTSIRISLNYIFPLPFSKIKNFYFKFLILFFHDHSAKVIMLLVHLEMTLWIPSEEECCLCIVMALKWCILVLNILNAHWSMTLCTIRWVLNIVISLWDFFAHQTHFHGNSSPLSICIFMIAKNSRDKMFQEKKNIFEIFNFRDGFFFTFNLMKLCCPSNVFLQQ